MGLFAPAWMNMDKDKALKQLPEYQEIALMMDKLQEGCGFEERSEISEKLIAIAKTTPEAILPVWDHVQSLVEGSSGAVDYGSDISKNHYVVSGIGLAFPTCPFAGQ